MKTFLSPIVLLLSLSLAVAEDQKKTPEPEGQPDYQRNAEGWVYGCWLYPKAKVVHGRLMNKDGEVLGKKDGETIKTTLGTLVWRGAYLPDKTPARSTGWLFVESFSGPPFIRDSYNPETGEIGSSSQAR